MFRAALIGAAITLGLIVIPIVHFVTAIPSPLIGGYFAGVRAEVEGGQAFVLGTLMSAILVVPLAGVLWLFSALFLRLTGVQFFIGLAVVFVGIAALASLGAVLGGAHARRQASAASS